MVLLLTFSAKSETLPPGSMNDLTKTPGARGLLRVGPANACNPAPCERQPGIIRSYVRCASFASFWPRADHFRSSLMSGHFQIPSACLKGAINGTRRPHQSITSFAWACSLADTSRPCVLAVLRLIVRSYLTGSCTGKLAGFSPFRMRST